VTKRKEKADSGLPPEDLMLHPGHLLRRALQAMNLLWDEEVSHTVTSPQFATLNALLCEPHGLDQRTLGSRVSLDRSTMDGRRKAITLTAKGAAVMQNLIPRTHVMTGRLVRALDQRERAELLRLLKIIVGTNERA